jgi:MFS superfamily sulfate permease-like transporter
LRAKRLRNPDAVGMRELDQFLRRMQANGIRVVLAGVRADLLDGLRAAGALDGLGSDQVFTERRTSGSSTIEAVRAAYVYLDRTDPVPTAMVSIPPTLAHFQV